MLRGFPNSKKIKELMAKKRKKITQGELQSIIGGP